jgi:hypothetical protein
MRLTILTTEEAWIDAIQRSKIHSVWSAIVYRCEGGAMREKPGQECIGGEEELA